MSAERRLFVLLYTASGAAALVYEVAWTRLLTLQLGHTVAAASTVLAAFMGGLAIGAWATGSRVTAPDRTTDPLKMYAALEIGVAVAALLLPFALRATVPALAWAYADGEAPVRFGLLRLAICLGLVGVPAVAMGATFPIATRWYATSPADAGRLYAANTAGAAVGAIAAGFWLIPVLGLRGTTWIGIALNTAAAAGALWIASASTIDAEIAEPAETTPKATPRISLRAQHVLRSPSSSPAPMLALTAAAVSGFAALIYEVAWTRLLALVIGPTTYAFATMAAAFIAGLALGSAAGTRLARRVERPAVWLALVLAAGAVAANTAAWYGATRMPLIVANQVADPAANFSGVIFAQAIGVALLLMPMTLALGATFPLALAAAGHASTVVRDTARVYTANTVGAITGALAAGFVLIPQLGLRATIRDAAVLAALGGAGCLAAALRASGTATRQQEVIGFPMAVAIVTVSAIVLAPPWDRALLASGAYKYAPYLGAVDLDAVLRAGTIEYYKEGAAGTVSVRLLTGTRSLAIDGKVDASNGGDMLTQRLLGLLPVLIHGRARDVCIIGLGSGVTVGAALGPGTVHRADVVEISPEVVEASHFFDAENGRALAQPGVRLIVGDGRSHLLFTPRRYDVIVSEPSNPWMAGVASLFTREFFEAARSKLKPEGLLCQWAHTYDISPADLRSIVRTFSSVFPHATLWLVGDGDLLLIGANADAITERLTAVEAGSGQGATASLLADVGIAEHTAPFALLSLFAGGPREIERYAGNATMQTDDRTGLEYSAPRGIYGRTKDDNVAAIRALNPERVLTVRQAFERASDAAWVSRGTMELKAQAFAPAYEAFRQATAINSRNTAALAGMSDAAGGAGRLNEEREWLRALAAREPGNAAVRIELSRILAVGGDVQGALQAASEAVPLAPDDPRPAEQFASVLADAGDGERLTPVVDALMARFPDRIEPQYYRATALFLRGRTEDAAAAARQIVGSAPGHARAQGLLAAACATLGRRECAQSAFDAYIGLNPRDPSGYVNAGVFNLRSADAAAAVDYFASAVALDPTSASARGGLSQARALLANGR
ncbi:MAG: tetratricopeptide repeat protein [Acidobacteria bacterium]|nr:tetratricopeptide repeat protein [Acidobacteriota bacterium]